MRCQHAHEFLRAGSGERWCVIVCCRAPTDSVAAGDVDVKPGGAHGLGQDGEEIDGFGRIGADLHLGVAGLVVGFVEEAEVRDGHAGRFVELDVFDEEVGVGLAPVAGRAGVTGCTA